MFGVSEAAVRKRYERARKAVREYLSKYNFNSEE
jgi:DNA-directed RNA polymerase specialized sigma24 family protein